MKTTLLYYTNIITPSQIIEHGTVAISDGKIIYAGPMQDAPEPNGPVYDLHGKYIAPGFFDVHVHGGKGVSFGETTNLRQELETFSRWVVSTGVTHYLCSIAAPDPEALVEMIRAFAQVMDEAANGAPGIMGAQPMGLHLEGPFINPKKKGAFNPTWLHAASIANTKAFLEAGRGWVRQMTLAPELPGAQEVAGCLRSAGAVAALGHTDTDYETASQALRGDFRHVTHTFNAQSGFNHRQPGVFGAVMASDQVTAELIADTIHVHPGAMKTLVRCLGTERIVLITDAISGAGLPDGVFNLVGQVVTVKAGRATLADGTIAGSTVALNQCVRNMHQQVGVSLVDAVKMATLNPARAMGLDDRLGKIEVGRDANLVVFDEDVNVVMTIVKGEVIYQAM